MQHLHILLYGHQSKHSNQTYSSIKVIITATCIHMHFITTNMACLTRGMHIDHIDSFAYDLLNSVYVLVNLLY